MVMSDIMDIMQQAKGNSKVLWNYINKLSGRVQVKSGPLELKVAHQYNSVPTVASHSTIYDSLEVANIFNNHFISSVSELGGTFFSCSAVCGHNSTDT